MFCRGQNNGWELIGKLKGLLFQLVAYCLAPRSRIFHAYGDVIFASDELQKYDKYETFWVFEVEGIIIVLPLL
jgi:hypothetical protein